MQQKRFTKQDLIQFATEVYTALGVSGANAELLADTLCQADLWGHASHGVMRTFWYARRMQSGATRIDLAPELVVDASAVAVVDGRHGIGQVVADFAVKQAIARAKQFGVGAVAVRNSGHFGTAMYFTRQAALNGCIGFVSTNASPAMAPWGGREKMIGTNPWSIAAPAGRFAPMMLDIANTAVARGKLYVAKQRGESIPQGWAIDAEGRATTDPVEGIAGNILPMAGHKGYAIATMMDVLSGVLSASGFADSVVGPYEPVGDSGVGHMITVLDIEAYRPLTEFNTDMEAYIDTIKNTPLTPDCDEIFYPGELEAANEQRLISAGIEIDQRTLQELNDAAQQLGVPVL